MFNILFSIHSFPWQRKQEMKLIFLGQVSHMMMLLENWVPNQQGRGEPNARMDPFHLSAG
jgi:hypothetical protein